MIAKSRRRRRANPVVVDVRDAIRSLRGSHLFAATLVGVLLGVVSVGEVVVDALVTGSRRHVPTWLQVAFGSSVQSLLLLLLGLLAALAFYIRGARGHVDGDSSYSIARALSYGYFKNFLVPALMSADEAGVDLHVLKPSTMEDLRNYQTVIQPIIDRAYETEWVPVAQRPDQRSGPRRSVLSVQRPRGRALHFFDAPTTLFTIGDFYTHLQEGSGGAKQVTTEWIADMTQRQITAFFANIDEYFTETVGVKAVEDLLGADHDVVRQRLGRLKVRLKLRTYDDVSSDHQEQ